MTSAVSHQNYELAVLEKIRLEFAGMAVNVLGTEEGRQHRVQGRYSLVERQIDVAAYRPESPLPFLVADAKRHKNKIDVKDAECFIGMIDDLGAPLGILVAANGFTDAAIRRAAAVETRVWILTIDQALTYRWMSTVRSIYPYDWVFHENLAHVVRLLDERAFPEKIIEALQPVAFEEWTATIHYALKTYPQTARRLLCSIARHHENDGWRYNAVQHLIDSGSMSVELRDELLHKETDHEVRELLQAE